MNLVISKNKKVAEKTYPLMEFQNIENFDPAKFKKIGKANSLMGQLPALVSAKALSGAYKVIMPSGSSGTLMKLQSGYLSTVMVKEGKIVAQAGLQSISGLVSPMVIFSAMSFITGQYFMSEINKSLEDIVSEIKGIRKLLLLEQESAIFSKAIFLEDIKYRWSSILESEIYRTATLVNIQNSINELTSSIYFLNSVLSDEIAEMKKVLKNKKSDINEINLKIQDSVLKISKAYEIRAIFKAMELILARIPGSEENEDVLSLLEDEAESFHSNTIGRINKLISETSIYLKDNPKTISQQVKTKGIMEILNSTKELFDLKSAEGIMENTKNSLRKALEINDRGYQISVYEGELYLDR